MAPEVLAAHVVAGIDRQHAFLINRSRNGSMVLPGETLFVMEMRPAAYAILAANEAEKSANTKLVECRMMGASGRLYLSGSELDVRTAADHADRSLRSLA